MSGAYRVVDETRTGGCRKVSALLPPDDVLLPTDEDREAVLIAAADAWRRDHRGSREDVRVFFFVNPTIAAGFLRVSPEERGRLQLDEMVAGTLLSNPRLEALFLGDDRLLHTYRPRGPALWLRLIAAWIRSNLSGKE